MATWSVGDYLTHAFNPELGIGRVTAVDARSLVVDFPRAGTTLRLAAGTDVLRAMTFEPGRVVRLVQTGERTSVIAVQSDGGLRLANGHTVTPDAVWPIEFEGGLLDRLASGNLDHIEDFIVRLRVLQLLQLRQADGLGPFLGGRVRLFPHQLYVAERASSQDPVRWLLADEVGLGKTIEAALILNRLVHTSRVERCLVVVPEALTVQWLGELWRKYHQVFTLLDAPRLADVVRDFGDDFNPFELHRRAVIAIETLVERPRLTAQAVAAGIDLLVVDEAQRLRRPPGHPGEPAWRAVAPIAAAGRHVLLLTATPLEDDVHGFFRLLQLLRPDEFPEGRSFEDRLATGVPLPPCTSSTRRSDIGGLPPRVGIPVTLERAAGADAREDLENEVRAIPATNPVTRRQKAERIRRAFSSGAALRATLGPADAALRARAEAADRNDPRLAWLASHARGWRDAREKTLVFVADGDTLEVVRTSLSHRAQIATGVFHEELSAARRDTEVARFREADGPSILVSTECGGEGRNFEFCRRLVLFDLPWKPTAVEQRIGRLDRIGRRVPVEIVYFRPPGGIGRDVVRLFEALGIFREPLAGLEPELAHVESAIEEAALDPGSGISDERFGELVNTAHTARTRVREAAYQQLHRNPYRSEMAAGILARVPQDLDRLNEEAVVAACARLGFGMERPGGRRAYAFELGNAALVDSLPGVPGGSTFVGTFNREEAVERETLDFFASGHPLVEGVFAHVEESNTGRVAILEIAAGLTEAVGLVAVYSNKVGLDVIVRDLDGQLRTDWLAAIRQQVRGARPDNADGGERIDWSAVVRQIRPHLDPSREPHAVAGLVVRPVS
jgi:ATP-dependent helicase HepA